MCRTQILYPPGRFFWCGGAKDQTRVIFCSCIYIKMCTHWFLTFLTDKCHVKTHRAEGRNRWLISSEPSLRSCILEWCVFFCLHDFCFAQCKYTGNTVVPISTAFNIENTYIIVYITFYFYNYFCNCLTILYTPHLNYPRHNFYILIKPRMIQK